MLPLTNKSPLTVALPTTSSVPIVPVPDTSNPPEFTLAVAATLPMTLAPVLETTSTLLDPATVT